MNTRVIQVARIFRGDYRQADIDIHNAPTKLPTAAVTFNLTREMTENPIEIKLE